MSETATTLTLGHISIFVSDLERAEKFYSGLNMTVISRFDEYVFLKASQGILGLRKFPNHFQKADQVLDHFGFFVDSREGLHQLRESLIGKGAKATSIVQHRDGFTSFYFFDPDGNKIQALYPQS